MMNWKSNNWLALAVIIACFTLPLALAAANQPAGPGSLSLVSVGAGDPDNMTIRARKTIDAADIFFTMGGRSERYGELLQGKPVYNAAHGLFGSGGAKPRMSAEEADNLRRKNRLIIREAVAAGKQVVILDNGDPTIFGPHIGYLDEFADLNPVIVPGLSSFNAANAALKTSVVGGSGHAVMLTFASLRDGRDKFLADTIAQGVTLAFFMVRELNEFITALQAHLPKETPVAIAANAGSASRETVIVANLDTILARVGQEKLPPYLLYVGDFLKK